MRLHVVILHMSNVSACHADFSTWPLRSLKARGVELILLLPLFGKGSLYTPS